MSIGSSLGGSGSLQSRASRTLSHSPVPRYSLRSRRNTSSSTTQIKASGNASRDSDDEDDGVESDDGISRATSWQSHTTSPSNTNYKQFKWWQSGYLKYRNFHEVPRYLQDNPDIHGHYRAYYSYTENWISLFHLHNESVNSWCHLLAGIFTILLAVFALQGITVRAINLNDSMDRFMICLYGILSTFTFLTSSMYHLHLAHSLDAYIFFGCWDYAGISATCSWVVHYGVAFVRGVWLTLVLGANLVGIVGPYFSFWPTSKFRPFRSLIYITSAVISGAPAFHFVLIHGLDALPSSKINSAVPMLGLSILMYVCGVAVYISRFPESVWPGHFDIWGASHQIWHTFVVLAVVAHLYCVFGLIEWRHQSGSCESLQ